MNNFSGLGEFITINYNKIMEVIMVKDSHAPKNKANAPYKLPDEQRRAKGKSNTRGNRN